MLPPAEKFLSARRYEEKFRRHFQRLRLIPNRLRERQHWHFAQAGEQLLLSAGQSRCRRNCGFFRLAGHNIAHERMQQRDKIAQMPPLKIERHFNGEKLMPLVRLPHRAQWLFAAPVKSGGQRRERSFLFVEINAAIAFKVQANFNAAGMKTYSPIKFIARLKIMPLETHARAMHAAVQMPPAVANRAPCRTFGEQR